MANANSTLMNDAAARLLTWAGSAWNCYRGTEAELVEAGIVKAEWLPGLHGNAKTATRVGLIEGAMKLLPFGVMATRFQEENRLIRIFRASKSTFRVQVSTTPEEREREIEQENAARQREILRRDVERIHAEKQQVLDAFPKSSEQFSAKRYQILKEMLGPMFNHYFCRADGGYHYSREVIEKARDLVTDLLELAEEGQVYFDKQRYQYSLDDIKEKDIKAHPEFSAFMAATLAIGKAATVE
ncbi:hypothetical protein C8R31_101127 [Nitrosospira sp. Nsp2]|uniref:hypothetical protein n=1 Tax=Nitrosospira sp. Nsp2 TaxID=136548 RepID=UPI000D4BF785|nr:hypothetical protein [Nitrosospira sp. Nsp2]PTR16974.1 hypothetical protein C8R31_101127 [Nitrosospira sp. Nsp2]